ncbi:MAG: alginate export family protein [Planctomycetes bacterium]|nr:alginate export family protein [Planctomycetota bacterium]
MKPPILIVLMTFAACVAPDHGDLSRLQPGRYFEAKGRIVDGSPLVEEIAEIAQGSSPQPDKVEITAAVESADGTRVRTLGHEFELTEKTEYEDEARGAVAPFVADTGDWLRIKARIKPDGLRARTLRHTEPRDRFEVAGQVRGVDERQGWLDLGGLRLPLAEDVDIELTGARDPDDPLSLFLADDQKAVPFTLRATDALMFGGQVSTNIEWDDEYDLDATDAGDRTKPALQGKIDALWLLDDNGSYVLGEVSAGRRETHREGGATTADDQLEVTRAFASLRATDGLQLLFGRQDFDEEREWLYDEVLDGARAVVRHADVELEVAAAVGREIMAEPNATENTGLYVANLRWRPQPRWTIGAYALQRTDDTAAGFEPRLYGVRSFARPRYGLGHWFELGLARGDAGNRSIHGHAFDAGVLYTFDAPLRPSLGAGIAFGSGERDSSPRLGYRQSGLQDNNGKLGGVTSVRYYGELFRPELANLTVTTAVAAIRPWRGASISLLLHGYRQDVAATTSPGNDLRTSSNGLSTDLGREIDLVLGYRLRRQLTLELVLARFDPGAAFSSQDAANLLEFTARFSF